MPPFYRFALGYRREKPGSNDETVVLHFRELENLFHITKSLKGGE